MKTYIKFFLCLLIPLTIGAFGGIATSSGVNDWYLTINKPSFNPPNYLFGPVWTVLYLLMGISLFLILNSKASIEKNKSLLIFVIQLFLNLLWSILFFKFQFIALAFIEIILICVSVLIMILFFYKVNKAAALLQIPYLMWLIFASILNGAILYLNS
jgi:tryptophan-rich sensory protein